MKFQLVLVFSIIKFFGLYTTTSWNTSSLDELVFFRQFLSSFYNNQKFFKIFVQITRIWYVRLSHCEHFFELLIRKLKIWIKNVLIVGIFSWKTRKLSKFLWTGTSSWSQLVQVQVQADQLVLVFDINFHQLVNL